MSIGIAVDQLRAIFELAVDFEDFPFDRDGEHEVCLVLGGSAQRAHVPMA